MRGLIGNANRNESTGFRFGCMDARNNMSLWERITDNGKDLTFEEQRNDVKKSLESALQGVYDDHDELPDEDGPEKQAIVEEMKAALISALDNYTYREEKLVDDLDLLELYEAMLDDKSAAQIDYDAMLSKLEDCGLWDNCSDDEPHNYYYEYDTPHGKVKLKLSSLGGAPLLFVLESPYVIRAQQCSPCVPGAGNLDHPDPHGILCHALDPEEWPFKGQQPWLHTEEEPEWDASDDDEKLKDEMTN